MTSAPTRNKPRSPSARPQQGGAGRKSPTSPAKRASQTPRSKAVAELTGGAPASAARAKPKLVRDSFTIPKVEYAVLEGLKLRAANLARPTKKSELLRAGIVVLKSLSDAAFLTALRAIPSLKTGRPKGARGSEQPGKGAP